jgi:2-oxoglutarate ferredoxin oxidoreductase subunit alpha
MDYTIKICGEAGQGLQTIGSVLGKVFSRSGYHVFTHQDYESRVRGGHNFYQLRVSDRPVMASLKKIDILVGLDRASIGLHKNELSERGFFLYDPDTIREIVESPAFLAVPFRKIAVDEGGSPVMSNTVAVGAVLGMLGMETAALEAILKDTFRKKGDAVIQNNIRAARTGYDYALKKCATCSFASVPASGKGMMLINGIDAIAAGAIASGVKFYSAYPMTPSTGIMNFLASKAKDCGLVVEQAEDEIAAINMALGASFSGVRAMTGTSGGGFALMVEGLSLAGMTETPIVIAEGQRPGPATGLPTRTEQGDLLFVLHAAHGEFPRIVFAPGTPEQAFYLTNKAFELSEKYQIPALLLFDQYLADTEWTYGGFDTGRLLYKDYRLRGEDFGALAAYKRHAFTNTGVTALGVPGDAAHLVVTDSDEHDEEGHIIEDSGTRIKMVEKRLFKKLRLIREEISPPSLSGDEKADIIIAGWGSTFGVIKEAVDELSKNNKIAFLHFTELYPFPLTDKFDYLKLLKNAKYTICIENNATGQFARHMRAETGFGFDASMLKYDGRPFLLEELIGELDAGIGRL